MQRGAENGHKSYWLFQTFSLVCDSNRKVLAKPLLKSFDTPRHMFSCMRHANAGQTERQWHWVKFFFFFFFFFFQLGCDSVACTGRRRHYVRNWKPGNAAPVYVEHV